MNPLFAAASEIEDLCKTNGLQFCLIGGLAVLRWGEPGDIDITVLALDGTEPQELPTKEWQAARD